MPMEYVEETQNLVELEEELAQRLNTFASRLSKLATEQVAKKNQVEQRWLEDIRQYHGEYNPSDLSRLRESMGSEVFVNITRNKTNAAEARLQDMLFPTDDRNWGITPTPVPELEKLSNEQSVDPQTGEPLDAIVVARELLSQAKEKASAMQEEIDDQLTESRYQPKARDIIHDACQLGTGVVKGPVIVGRTKKRWDTLQDGVSVLQIVEALEPSVERVDPWDFFPDMSATRVDEAEFFFERRRLSKKQLRDMAKLPGVLTSQVRELVKNDAKSTHIARTHIDDIRNITGINTIGEGNKYEVWEYHGPISKSEFLDAMMGSDSEYTEEEIDELDDEIEAVVFFSANSVIKVVINPMDSGDRPYSVFNWETDESSIFGFGVPYLMRNPQKVINAAWRMMMDNSGLSVADQLVINRELLQPADGSWEMTPKKMWYLRDKTRSVQEAFASFSTPSHQQEMANIFQMARQLADEETNLPLIAQGEQSSHITKTSSGMAMLMNSSNIVLRKAVKNWDDDISRPLITRFYDWNMQFNDNPNIKGDFSIDARGSGALLVREKQQENLMVYANISASNPFFSQRRDWAGLDREIAKSLEVPYENITLSDAEIAEATQAQQEQPDPNQIAAEMESQIKQAELQLEQQKLQLQAQIKSQEFQLKQSQIATEAQLDQQKLVQDRELRIAEIAAKGQMTERQLQTRMAIDSEKIRSQRDKDAGDLNIKTAQTQLQAKNISKGYDTF